MGQSGNDPGMIAFCHRPDARHDALHIDNHSVDRPGHNRQLLGEEVGQQGHSLTHQDLVTGTADPHALDPLCANRLGLRFHLAGSADDHLAKKWVMAVQNDIDHLRIDHPEVRLGGNRFGRTKKNIGKIGSNMHPDIVGQGCLQPLEDQVDRIGVNPHMRLTHRFRDGGMDTTRLDVAVSEFLHPPLGNSGLQPAARLIRDLRKIAHRNFEDLFQQLALLFTFHGETDVLGYAAQLSRIFNIIIKRPPLKHLDEGIDDMPTVICVSTGSTVNSADEVTGDNSISVRPADTL